MYSNQLQVATEAVFVAMQITRSIQSEISGADTVTKSDRSPVTVADFASQALICGHLHSHFPSIPIVAEERSALLRETENFPLVTRILESVRNRGELGKIDGKDLLNLIDLGGSSPGDTFWTLDPIDGTKGFLRGEQFAIALALIDKGKVQIGILGCPNLTPGESEEPGGCLVTAVRGEGAWIESPSSRRRTQCHVSTMTEAKNMRFVESYVSAHSHSDLQLQVARELGIRGNPVRMDSQVKYAVVSSGRAEIYMRIPHPDTPDYKEKIWDHAAGSLIVTEAGGEVSDIEGRELDFSAGRILARNRGILATTNKMHKKVIRSIRMLEEKRLS